MGGILGMGKLIDLGDGGAQIATSADPTAAAAVVAEDAAAAAVSTMDNGYHSPFYCVVYPVVMTWQ